MSKSKTSLEQRITSRQRDIWIVTSVVFLAMGAGVAVMWPSVKAGVVSRFGAQFPTKVLLADFLFLVTFLIVYVWHSGSQLKGLVRRLVLQRGQNAGLEVQLDTLRSILEASSQADQSSAEYLSSLMHLVTESLRADQCVLYRARQDGILERDSSFPSAVQAPEPELMQFEDEVALAVIRSGQTTLIWDDTDPAELGLHSPRPEQAVSTMAATPLVVDDEVAGVLLIRNPCGLISEEFDDEGLQYLQIFAGFASGVVRNLRAFQEIAQSKADLDRAHETLMEQQRELSEVETVTALSRIAYTMAHGMSSPLTALSGYADLLKESAPDTAETRMAHKGLSAEVVKLRDRMQSAIDFTSAYRSRYELIDLNGMVQDTLENCRTELESESVAVTLEVYEDLPLTMVDVVRMRQVLLTLFKYVKKTLHLAPPPRKLKVRTLPYSGMIRVQFLFPGWSNVVEAVEPLLKTNVEMDSMQRNQEGLSVAIASNIIRHHQGEVSVDLDGQMVLVTVEVPIRRDAPPTPRGFVAVAPECGKPQRVEEVLDQIMCFGEPEPQIAKLQSETTEMDHEVPIEDAADIGAGIDDPFGVLAETDTGPEDQGAEEPGLENLESEVGNLDAVEPLVEPVVEAEPPTAAVVLPDEVPEPLKDLGSSPVVHEAPAHAEPPTPEQSSMVNLFGLDNEAVPTVGAPLTASTPPSATPDPTQEASPPTAKAPAPAASPPRSESTPAPRPAAPPPGAQKPTPGTHKGLPPMQASEHRSQLHLAPTQQDPTAVQPKSEAPPPEPAAPRPKTDQAKLDDIFGPGDIYRGPHETIVRPVTTPAAPPAEVAGADSGTEAPAAESKTAPLLDGGEIEDALKLFDEADG